MGLSGLLILAAGVVYAGLVYGFFQKWETSGVFGDSFGALTCLFSALAFAGLLYTIRDQEHQRREDEVEQRRERLRSDYATLLAALEHRLQVAEKQPAYDPTELADLQAKLRFYSERLEEAILGSAAPLLSDDKIVEEFAKVPWFEKADLRKSVDGIRKRLAVWNVSDPRSLELLVDDVQIREKITEIYKRELYRAFDPGALATWGGMLFRQGLSDATIERLLTALYQSSEYREKNPPITSNPNP